MCEVFIFRAGLNFSSSPLFTLCLVACGLAYNEPALNLKQRGAKDARNISEKYNDFRIR